VSVDPLYGKEQEDAQTRGRVVAFLTRVGATFPNFLLAEEQEVWQDKFGALSPPVVFVFDRKGRRAAKFDPDKTKFTYEDVEKLVRELLREKP